MFKFRKLDFVLTTRSRAKKYRIRGYFTLNNSNKKERLINIMEIPQISKIS